MLDRTPRRVGGQAACPPDIDDRGVRAEQDAHHVGRAGKTLHGAGSDGSGALQLACRRAGQAEQVNRLATRGFASLKTFVQWLDGATRV